MGYTGIYIFFSNYCGTSVRTASAIGGSSLFNLCWSKNEKYKKDHFETEKKNVFTVWVRFRKFIRIIYVREAYAPLNRGLPLQGSVPFQYFGNGGEAFLIGKIGNKNKDWEKHVKK